MELNKYKLFAATVRESHCLFKHTHTHTPTMRQLCYLKKDSDVVLVPPGNVQIKFGKKFFKQKQ